MPIAIFNMNDVDKLITELKSATQFLPSMDDLFDKNMHVGGKILDKDGLTERQAKAKKLPFWPSAKNIDVSKLAPMLQLVGDHGVYLITNAKFDGTPSSRGTVAYAKGCNPQTDKDFYENKENIFGGDDGSIYFPLEWAEAAQKKGEKYLQIKINRQSVALLLTKSNSL